MNRYALLGVGLLVIVLMMCWIAGQGERVDPIVLPPAGTGEPFEEKMFLASAPEGGDPANYPSEQTGFIKETIKPESDDEKDPVAEEVTWYGRTLDSDGLPVKGVKIDLGSLIPIKGLRKFQSSGMIRYESTKSNDEGRFLLDRLKPGTYRVITRIPFETRSNVVRYSSQDWGEITFEKPGSVEKNLYLHQWGARIEGRVLAESTGRPIQEEGLCVKVFDKEGAKKNETRVIDLFNVEDERGIITTEKPWTSRSHSRKATHKPIMTVPVDHEDGSYSIRNLSPGIYDFHLIGLGPEPVSLQDITVYDGQIVSSLDIIVPARGKLRILWDGFLEEDYRGEDKEESYKNQKLILVSPRGWKKTYIVDSPSSVTLDLSCGIWDLSMTSNRLGRVDRKIRIMDEGVTECVIFRSDLVR